MKSCGRGTGWRQHEEGFANHHPRPARCPPQPERAAPLADAGPGEKATKAIVSIYTRQALLGVDITGIERATYDVELGLARGEKTKDPDNLGASLKYHIDAIAYECLVDDRHWETGARTQVRDPEGVGYLTIRLTWEAA